MTSFTTSQPTTLIPIGDNYSRGKAGLDQTHQSINTNQTGHTTVRSHQSISINQTRDMAASSHHQFTPVRPCTLQSIHISQISHTDVNFRQSGQPHRSQFPPIRPDTLQSINTSQTKCTSYSHHSRSKHTKGGERRGSFL